MSINIAKALAMPEDADDKIHTIYTTVNQVEILGPSRSKKKSKPSTRIVHERYADLIRLTQCRDHKGVPVNVCMVGQRGTMKTTHVKYLADDLGLEYYITGKIEEPYQLIGYRDANGNYQKTRFVDLVQKPSLILVDEVDGSSDEGLLSFNSLLANRVMDTPDGMVYQHKDCHLLGAANTAMDGATMEYNSRHKMDDSEKDRWQFIDWGVDEGLESAITKNWGHWSKIVQMVRRHAEVDNQPFLSMRTSFDGISIFEGMASQGESFEKAFDMVWECKLWPWYPQEWLATQKQIVKMSDDYKSLRVVYTRRMPTHKKEND